MNFRTCVVAALAVALSAASLAAQWYRGGRRQVAVYGAGWGWKANFASTPQEGYARGMADMIRAQGQAAESAARAAIDYETARSAYIQNQKLWHETALQREQYGLQRREQYYAAQRAARDRRAAMAENAPPPTRLSSSQYDRASGLVKWPEALQTEAFAKDRAALEELLVVKAHTGHTGNINQKIYDAAKAMQARLKSQIRDLHPNVYLDARKFLDYLAAEARDDMMSAS
jgi:hypothetical protein